MMLRNITLLLALTFVGCREYRGDQGLPAAAEKQQEILIEFGNENFLDENIQEMTQENTQLEGDAVERINEDEVDDEIASGEKHESYPALICFLLGVQGCAVGLVLYRLLVKVGQRQRGGQ